MATLPYSELVLIVRKLSWDLLFCARLALHSVCSVELGHGQFLPSCEGITGVAGNRNVGHRVDVSAWPWGNPESFIVSE